MGGMLLTSLAGGQIVTRTGRYKALLVVGSVVMAIGLFWSCSASGWAC
jgi:hypothetical protein